MHYQTPIKTRLRCKYSKWLCLLFQKRIKRFGKKIWVLTTTKILSVVCDRRIAQDSLYEYGAIKIERWKKG